MLPFVEVTHLPSSASFYAAVTQPLGLRYIAAQPLSITYGRSSSSSSCSSSSASASASASATTADQSLFEVKAIGDKSQPLKLSRLVLSAVSSAAVADFHAAALRANPDLLIGTESNFLRLHQETGLPDSGASSDSAAAPRGESHAKITDLDGNIMEVIYVPPRDYPANYDGSTIRRTQSNTEEVSRILDWNYAVASKDNAARSLARSGPANGSESANGPYSVLRRSVTTSVVDSPPRQSANGASTTAVIGTVLGAVAGAAAGAALTYTMLRNDRAKAPRQEFEAPPFQRRSTFPDPYPDRRGQFVEVERTVERIRYPQDYPQIASDRRYPPPTYLARYSEAGVPRSRELEEVYDDQASRRSTRYSSSRSTKGARAHSEVSSTRRPLMLQEADHRSYVTSSRHTTTPKLLTDADQHSYTTASKRMTSPQLLADVERRSYAPSSRHSVASQPQLLPVADYRSHASSHHSAVRRSARQPEVETYVSGRSTSTVKPIRPPPVTAETVPLPVSRVGSRYSTATTARMMPTATSRPSGGRAVSYISAKDIALPGSHIGSSHANWDDDNDSIAPSDSISCVGSRRSGRSRH